MHPRISGKNKEFDIEIIQTNNIKGRDEDLRDAEFRVTCTSETKFMGVKVLKTIQIYI